MAQEDTAITIERMLREAPMDEVTLDRLNALIKTFSHSSDEKALPYAEKALLLSEAAGYEKGIIDSLARIGRSCERLAQYERSVQTYLQAKERSEKNEGYLMGAICDGLGANFYQLGDFDTSMQYSQKAYEAHQKDNDAEGCAVSLMHLGSIYSRAKDYTTALEYYNRALEQLKVSGNGFQESSVLGNMGGVYATMGEVDKALEYFNASLRMRDEMGDERFKGVLMNNIGQCYLMKKDYEKAKSHFFESVRIHNEFGNRVGETSALLNMGELAVAEGKHTTAVECLQKALVLAKELKLKYHQYHVHEMLYKAYNAMGDYSHALEQHEEFHRLKEEVHNQEAARKIQSAQQLHQLETARKESEIQRLKNVELKTAYEEIAVRTKEIQDSIRYAQRIQIAMYPLADDIGKLFPNSFGVRLAKHVVSGDFVWCGLQNGWSYMVLADCTGHGIPGAFMSMIGIEKLNQALYVQNCVAPSEVLRCVNQGIKFSLKQNSDDSPIRDGMDLAVCAFDFPNMKLRFAGANRPLYHIRNGELIEITPTKSAVGGLTPNHQVFVDHEVSLQKGDAIYMFTDGYADQFGGPNGKKFSTRRFKELLLSIYTKDEPTQSRILRDTLNEWKACPDKEGKEHEQTDDITIAGIMI